jgi:major membrane immunogen (membrane-anchored lipoprotein)
MMKKIIKLMTVIVAFSFMAGCGKRTPEPTATHHESGSYTLILSEIYDECMANNDIQGAKDALDMITKFSAFYCSYVNYDDVKNKNYNNIEFYVGKLQIAVAAYNEYNDEAAMDVEVDWICHYDSCTKEQLDAIDAYVNWYHTKKGNVLIEDYKDLVSHKYDEIKQNNDIPHPPAYDRLTPAQFKEVQNYIKDPSYQVDTTVWD